MAAFSEEEIRDNPYVWQMFRDGSVSLINRAKVLEKIISDLQSLGYTVHEIDCRFEDKCELEHGLRRVLHLGNGFGLDALNSQLWDLDFPNSTGLVIALRNIDDFNRRFPEYLWNVIDILVRESRLRMLQGQRLLVILNSEDTKIEIQPVGAINIVECPLKSIPK